MGEKFEFFVSCTVAHEGKRTSSHAGQQWGSGRIADEKNSVLREKNFSSDARVDHVKCDFF
jgi:hypothetical protein